ncbi:hypothetical protein BJ684DRAFT_15584, partial [Piptocephalis cylindrospora]
IQAAGGKKKNKKAVKMNLNDFLADSTTGTNWADEMDELPSAHCPHSTHPSSSWLIAAAAFGGDVGGDSRSRGFGSEFSRDFAPRGPQVLPTSPPFTAYVGNLPYENLTDESLTEFFTGCAVKNVRIIRDFSDQPKGFGYVEFEDVSSLEKAVALSGSPLNGRNLRINIAEQPKTGFGDRGAGPERSETDQWRRADSGSSTDLPRSGSTGGFARRDSSFSQGGDLGRADSSGGWRKANDFSPQDGPTPPGSARSPRFGFRRNQEGASLAEDTSDWRRDRPASRSPSVGRDISRTQSGSTVERGSRMGGGGFSSHHTGPSDTTWGGGAFTPRPAGRSPSRDFGSRDRSGGRDRSWGRPGHAKDTSWGGGAFTPRGRREERSTERDTSRDTSWGGGAFTPHSPRPPRHEGGFEADEERGRGPPRTKDTEWSGGAFSGKESFDRRRSLREEGHVEGEEETDEAPKGKSETEPTWRRPIVEGEEEEGEEEEEKKEAKKGKSETESTWRRATAEEDEEKDEKEHEHGEKKESKKSKSDTESTWRRAPAEEEEESKEEEDKEKKEDEKKEDEKKKENELMEKDTWRPSGSSPSKSTGRRNSHQPKNTSWSGGAFSRAAPSTSPEGEETIEEGTEDKEKGEKKDEEKEKTTASKNTRSNSAWGKRASGTDRTMSDKWERGVPLPPASPPPPQKAEGKEETADASATTGGARADRPSRGQGNKTWGGEDRASRSDWGRGGASSSPRPEGNVWEQKNKAAATNAPAKEDRTLGDWGKARAEAKPRSEDVEAPVKKDEDKHEEKGSEAKRPEKRSEEKKATAAPSKADTEDTWRVVTRKK